MNSTEKVFRLVETLQDLDDTDLLDAFPIPMGATAARFALATAASRIPTNPHQLDAMITRGIEFLAQLRSDDPALAIATAVTP